MKGIVWTDERIKALEALYLQGLSCSQIAAELKIGITRNAVIGKVNRLGLTRPFHLMPKHGPKKQALPKAKRTKQHSNPYTARWSGAPKLLPLDNTPLRCVEIIPRGLSLIELEINDCRWPYGDGPMTFCGHPKQEGSSYCVSHKSLGTISQRVILSAADRLEKRRLYMVEFRKSKRLAAVA